VLLADLLNSIHDIEDFREIFITESDTKKKLNRSCYVEQWKTPTVG